MCVCIYTHPYIYRRPTLRWIQPNSKRISKLQNLDSVLDRTTKLPVTQEQQEMKRSADLHELHEEVDVLGVELLAEVVDGLVHVLRQRVLLAAPDEVALAPDPLHVLPRRRRRRRRRDDDISAVSTGLRRGKGRRGCPERKGLFCALFAGPS